MAYKIIFEAEMLREIFKQLILSHEMIAILQINDIFNIKNTCITYAIERNTLTRLDK